MEGTGGPNLAVADKVRENNFPMLQLWPAVLKNTFLPSVFIEEFDSERGGVVYQEPVTIAL